MRLLIIGGTRFLGRFAATSALAAGHDVTLFHRGLFSANGIPGCRTIIGDRKGDLSMLDGDWDAVIDTCGYLPRDVRKSAAHLEKRGARKYLFVSTVNAYRSPLPYECNESALRWDDADLNAGEMTLDTYGPLKAACEQIVEDIFKNGAVIIRPGLIAGPYDSTDRFTYWVRRIAQGGDVLIPADNGRVTQIIDVRDLAAWLSRLLEQDRSGCFNATGPAFSIAEIVETCKRVTISNAQFKAASESFLLENKVEPWSEMPLWLPRGEEDNFDTIDSSKAREHGLHHASLEQTIADTHAWDNDRDKTVAMKAGLPQERESALLELLKMTLG